MYNSVFIVSVVVCMFIGNVLAKARVRAAVKLRTLASRSVGYRDARKNKLSWLPCCSACNVCIE